MREWSVSSALGSWYTVYIYIHCVVVNTRTQKVSWSLCVGGVTGTVFFFLNFFLRGTFGKGDRADDFFSYYILIQYIYYTAGYFRLQISMHLLFVCCREGAEKVTLDDRCQTKKNAIFSFCVCVCCVPLQRNSFRALVTHNTRPYNRLFCDSSFVHLFFWAHTIKTFLLLSIWTLWTSQWIAMVCLFLSYFFGYICQPRSFSLSVYRPFFTI
jgi:hypothetical protein